MRTRIHWLGIAMATTVALLSSCALEPTGRDGQTGNTFVLRTVDGVAVPAVVVSNSHVEAVKLADTIWLRANGTGREVTVERSSSDIALPPGEHTYRYEREFTYRVSAGDLEVEFPCPANASCVAPPHYLGKLTADVLRLDYALYYKVPLVFERIER